MSAAVSQYYGSRYSIKYHPNTQRFSFYLSGASFENRQDHYASLAGFLAELQTRELATYNVNDNIWQDISTDMVEFEIKHERATGYTRVKMKPTRASREVWNQFFEDEVIDLGLVPKDKDFATTIMRYYRQMPLARRKTTVKLHNIKFNAWDEAQSLLGVQFNVEGIPINLPESMTVINPARTETPATPSRVETAEPEQVAEIVAAPAYTIADSLESLIKQSCSQFASVFLIERLSVI